MKSSMILGQLAGDKRGSRSFAAARGTSLPGGLAVSLAGLAVTRPWPHELGLAATPQVTCKKYQHMTRIAANGGDVSGSHPAWDPV